LQGLPAPMNSRFGNDGSRSRTRGFLRDQERDRGRIYLHPLRGYLPDLWKEAPLERHVTREIMTLMGEGNSTTLELYSDRLIGKPYPSYTLLRAKFDRWFADLVRKREFCHSTEKRGRPDPRRGKGRRRTGRGGRDRSRLRCCRRRILSFMAEKAGLRKLFNLSTMPWDSKR